MPTNTNSAILPKSLSWQMFDDISPRYDFINHILSLGLDFHWRKCLVKLLPDKKDQNILDLATGTAAVLLSIMKNNPKIKTATGLDLSENMLSLGRRKVIQKGLDPYVTLKKGDAHQIPFGEHVFDTATISFGIRNMHDPLQVLKEMKRVLKPEGRALVLECSIPQNILIRKVYQLYMHYGVPLIGALFCRHRYAYDYLNKTVRDFPCGNEFCKMMERSGFKNVRRFPLMFGAMSIYTGDKAGRTDS